MTCVAVTELGLTAFLITEGNDNGTWPRPRYHSLLIMFAFNSSWTALFSAGYLIWMADGGVQMLASIASSVIWLFLTSILWGVAAGLMRITRGGGDCRGSAFISRCRQSLTVEALGWTQLGCCTATEEKVCLRRCTASSVDIKLLRSFRSRDYIWPAVPPRILQIAAATFAQDWLKPGARVESVMYKNHLSQCFEILIIPSILQLDTLIPKATVTYPRTILKCLEILVIPPILHLDIVIPVTYPRSAERSPRLCRSILTRIYSIMLKCLERLLFRPFWIWIFSLCKPVAPPTTGVNHAGTHCSQILR
ncbi:hypothetical protein AX14_006875 [Amanita brunnescens Koide BX004]|nr:hypothetical protein AX14_006875 [Amanita brunnescens Koide BX004]